MARRFKGIDLWIAVAALGGLAIAIWALVRAAKHVRMELIPPSLTITPERAAAYSLLCLIVGGLSMALVQIWRTLVPVRGFFQRAALLRFINESLRYMKFDSVRFLWEQSPHYFGGLSAMRALEEFELRAGRIEWHGRGRGLWGVLSPMLYDLSIEQLCGQLNLAFDAALTTPTRFPNLLLGVLGQEGLEPLKVAMQNVTDDGYEDEKQRDIRLLRHAEARALLSRMGQQRIDGFQIEVGGDWRRLLRLCVVVMSLAFSWQATIYHSHLTESFERNMGINSLSMHHEFESPTEAAPNLGFSGVTSAAGSNFDGQANTVPRGGSSGIQDDAQMRQLWKDEQVRESFGTHLFQAVLMGLISGYIAMVLRDLVAILELKRRQT